MVLKHYGKNQGDEISPKIGHFGNGFHELLWDAKISNNMIESKPSDGFDQVVKSRHVFFLLIKVINYNDDVFVAISRMRSTIHKVNSPFGEGASHDD